MERHQILALVHHSRAQMTPPPASEKEDAIGIDARLEELDRLIGELQKRRQELLEAKEALKEASSYHQQQQRKGKEEGPTPEALGNGPHIHKLSPFLRCPMNSPAPLKRVVQEKVLS
jgi:hypothetical protein